MSGTSVRTQVRDALANAFAALKATGAARVTPFAVSLRWLTEQETKQGHTYCIVITDEARAPQTLQQDAYDMTAVLVLYAYDTADPRAKLDAMIEDAIETVRNTAVSLTAQAWKITLNEITTDEGTTTAGPWAQAVLRWSVAHRRAAAA